MATKVTKVSLSLDDDALAWAKRRAKTSKQSLSAVISDALVASRARVEASDERERAWRKFMDWFELEQAPLTRDEIDAAGLELWGSPAAGRRPARRSAAPRKSVATRSSRSAARRAR